MILGSGLLTSGVPSFGTVAADSSDSALLAGQDALVCVCDGAAYIYFGKAAGTWKTLWADTTGGLLRGDTGGTYAVTLASDGPEPFDVAYGFATDRKAGSVAAGTVYTHTANFVLSYTLASLPVANTNVSFRRPNSSNSWQNWVNASGDLLLYEVVDGFPAQRASASGVVADGHGIVVIADGSTVQAFSSGAARWAYSNATNFVTATNGLVVGLGAGGISDLITWPRYASTVASVLNKVSA